MKKRILQSLVIFAINVVSGGLIILSGYLYLFRGDPILAAITALMPLPVILLQPWFFFLLLIPYGPILAPLLTTFISVLIVVSIENRKKLDSLKFISSRLKNPTILITIFCIFVFLIVFAVARYYDYPALNKGIPRTLEHSIQNTKIHVKNPRFYCLRSFLDSEWIFQAKLSEQDFDVLAKKLHLNNISISEARGAFRNMPPYWWKPVISKDIRLMSTKKFPMEGRGSDGRHILATWNPENGILHMWIKDNF